MITEIVPGVHIGSEDELLTVADYNWRTIDVRSYIDEHNHPFDNLRNAIGISSWIEESFRLGCNTMVFCDDGATYSPLVVAVWLKMYRDMLWDDAYDTVCDCIPTSERMDDCVPGWASEGSLKWCPYCRTELDIVNTNEKICMMCGFVPMEDGSTILDLI